MPTYNRGEWGSLRAIIISHRWRHHIFFHQIQVFSCSVLMTCSPLVYCFLALTGTTVWLLWIAFTRLNRPLSFQPHRKYKWKKNFSLHWKYTDQKHWPSPLHEVMVMVSVWIKTKNGWTEHAAAVNESCLWRPPSLGFTSEGALSGSCEANI